MTDAKIETRPEDAPRNFVAEIVEEDLRTGKHQQVVTRFWVLAVVFAMMGSWVSGMIAVSIPNSRLKRFQPAIDSGAILLMVDVPVRRVQEIRELIMAHHPEAQAKGLESQIPAFP